MIQWLIYGALVVGGYLLRHNGIALPGLPTPTPPALPTLSHFPRLNAVLSRLGPQAEGWLLELVQGELQKMANPAPAQTPGNGK